MSDTTPDPKPEVPAAASSADETVSPAPAAAEPAAAEPAAEPVADAPAAASAPAAAPSEEPAAAPEPAWASEPAPAPEAAPAAPAYSAPAPETAPPAYSAPPAYQQAPTYAAAPAYSAPAGPRTNTLAIVSLVAGIVGFVFLPFIAHLVAVITGHLSLGQIKRTGEAGHGMALTGTILGWVGLALSIIVTILIIIAVIGVAANYPNYRSA